MDKFKSKYRIPSARAPFWNYSWEGLYFVTICTHNQEHFFGEITVGMMKLSEIGNIVNKEWLKTFVLRPDMNLWMGEYIIMPNHFHAIIGIGKNQFNSDGRDAVQYKDAVHFRDAKHCVSTSQTLNHFTAQSKNLPSIVRGFKIGVTKNARLINPEFTWQTRYHDNIIRNDKSYQTIADYIINNPMDWKNDKFYCKREE